jgi:hypothetical protein
MSDFGVVISPLQARNFWFLIQGGATLQNRKRDRRFALPAHSKSPARFLRTARRMRALQCMRSNPKRRQAADGKFAPF